MSTPVVFIHGLWIHSSSWKPWIDSFNQAGYAATAPEWPGGSDTVAAARANPEKAAGYGVKEIVDHYAKFIATLPAQPVVIGHSFGGLIAQAILGKNLASAAVAIDPAPIKGVLALPLSALRVASVALRNPANLKKAVSLTAAEFRYGFGNMLSHEDSEELYRHWTIPSPARPLFQAAFANFNPNAATRVDTANANRGPLLLIAGEHDHTAPPAITRGTLKLYHRSPAITELREIPNRGHSLTIDKGWRDVATTALEWLKSRTG